MATYKDSTASWQKFLSPLVAAAIAVCSVGGGCGGVRPVSFLTSRFSNDFFNYEIRRPAVACVP